MRSRNWSAGRTLRLLRENARSGFEIMPLPRFDLCLNSVADRPCTTPSRRTRSKYEARDCLLGVIINVALFRVSPVSFWVS